MLKLNVFNYLIESILVKWTTYELGIFLNILKFIYLLINNLH